MQADNATQLNLPKVLVIGPLPPPVTGMTLLTQKVLQRLQEAGPVTIWNLSHGRPKNTPRTHAIRVFNTLKCAGKLMLHGRTQSGRLYLVANSRSGVLLTGALVFIGRRLGYRIYLHHHTYGYIDTYHRRMAWIDRQLREDSVHIVHCDQMISDFQRKYPTRCRFATVYPSVVSLDIDQPRLSPGSPFRLGMLSNLTIDKGVDLAISTFSKLHSEGRQVCLTLAGPIRSPAAKSLIDKALAEYPQQVSHLGAVYGQAKAQFFANIDALLFPTQYNEESWGIVLNESLAAGAPAITFDRGCTRTVVGKRAGLVVPREG